MIVWIHILYVSSDKNNTIYRRSFSLLELSAQRLRIINPGRFFMGGPPEEIRGGRVVVLPLEKIGDRGVVPMQDNSPLTVLLLLPRTSTEEGLRGSIW